MAERLDAIDGDIVILQEVCDCWTLRRLIELMKIHGAEYEPYLLKGRPSKVAHDVKQNEVLTFLNYQVEHLESRLFLIMSYFMEISDF